jgi:hypothetical protein
LARGLLQSLSSCISVKTWSKVERRAKGLRRRFLLGPKAKLASHLAQGWDQQAVVGGGLGGLSLRIDGVRPALDDIFMEGVRTGCRTHPADIILDLGRPEGLGGDKVFDVGEG